MSRGMPCVKRDALCQEGCLVSKRMPCVKRDALISECLDYKEDEQQTHLLGIHYSTFVNSQITHS